MLNRKKAPKLKALTVESTAAPSNRNQSDKDSGIIKLLEDIHEENERISELYAREKECVKVLSELLKDLMRTLNTSLVLSRGAFGRNGLDASRIYISVDSEVIIVQRDGQVKTMKLEEMSSPAELSILATLMPSLRKVIAAHRTEVRDRVNIFEKIIDQVRRSISSS